MRCVYVDDGSGENIKVAEKEEEEEIIVIVAAVAGKRIPAKCSGHRTATSVNLD